ncbi:50S ribosomal protein L10 [Candidatus Daviesbacteria bacterium]|nr:50S ribosomal protein L10 [Candidatus Daviesbacteria bacterium]
MAKTRQQKEETVQKIQEKLGRAKAVVFADYKGLNMKQLSDLRDKLREQNAEFSITKNTLLSRALPATNYQLPASPTHRGELTTNFEGPTATLYAYDDEISPIKILVKALKDAAIGKARNGFLGDMPLDEAKILQLSTLPTKDELRGKTVGVLVAPLQGIVSVLQGNLRNLVYALDAIRKTKGGE